MQIMPKSCLEIEAMQQLNSGGSCRYYGEEKESKFEIVVPVDDKNVNHQNQYSKLTDVWNCMDLI